MKHTIDKSKVVLIEFKNGRCDMKHTIDKSKVGYVKIVLVVL